MTLAAFTGVGLVLGWLADQALGDPRRFHPVAGFGRLAGTLEERTYRDHRGAGMLHVTVLVGGAAALGVAGQRWTQQRPALRMLAVAAATWTVLGGRSLAREATTIEDQLRNGDLAAARLQIRNLVGRDPSRLDAVEISRACLESVAENTSDAVVAPLFWGAVGGIPGLLAYRAVNTLDAMIGHRSERYLRFGWAAARLDDAANWVPARLAAGLAILGAPVVSGSRTDALRTVWADAAKHPSPNAGVVEAAFAGALGVRLGGVNVYHGQVEDRGTLGAGRPVEPADLARANRLARLVSVAALAVCAAAAALRARRGQRFRPVR